MAEKEAEMKSPAESEDDNMSVQDSDDDNDDQVHLLKKKKS